ncbi:DgyrCDS3311 [Dimorphilus gyrociliatus]|uniref:DgyrCDS3311 n=1 Tax=Dimorphilus gyrociliatus TaxID=2664684 RepID=A0A7I8VFJ4_9ANNE|nr:DgyrCDS3311 [Dimorphilus gyrociliatus]
MSDQKDAEKGCYKSEEKIALKSAEASNEATVDHEKSAVNGGETVKITDPNEKQADFCGLSKEELQHFANDPFWRKVRLILFIAFWAAWIAMLLAAILIIVVAPKCPERPKLKWWQKSLFYRVCPRTFLDSNGDGNGDFKGLESKIPYIHDEVHSDAIILTPIFKSKYNDLGFDVTALDSLNEEVFGKTEDFKSLIKKAHGKNIKVVLDFVVNNIDKDSGRWTEASKFVSRSSQPSNLESLYKKDSWNKIDNTYYYSTLSADHLDLALEDKDVFSYVETSLKKWLDLGIDGIRIPHSAYLVEGNATITEENRILTEGTYTFLKKISKILNTYDDKVLIADLGKVETSDEQVNKLFESGVNLVDSLNLEYQESQPSSKADLFEKIEKTLNQTDSRWPTWNVGNEDTSRFGNDVAIWQLRSVLSLLLKGTSIVYYGNELAMTNSNIANEKDKYMKRDKFRAPMMWEDTVNGGFTKGKPWLEIEPASISIKCVACQLAAKKAPLKFFQELANIRKEPSFQWGPITLEATENHKVIVFIRQATGFAGYVVIINIDPKHRATINLKQENKQLPDKATVVIATENSEKKVGDEVDLKLAGIPQQSGLVLKWEWKDWNKDE